MSNEEKELIMVVPLHEWTRYCRRQDKAALAFFIFTMIIMVLIVFVMSGA